MLKYFVIFFLIFVITEINASNKEKIIENLKNTKNLTFDFEQSINEKTEKGNCTIEYDKKIYCKYLNSDKILVSNGKSLVIKNLSSYYIYPLDKTSLNLILDKNFLINKITFLEEETKNTNYINYNFFENESEIKIFFDNINYNLIGWQMLDIYQNLNITFISSIKKNENIKKNLFNLPSQN
ncbi:MAG: outer membrane lipoprotein carrier protein LolA [Pelagibacteraceae bacterium]|nr:outer membrane lipoprotein carrier protein LolA [Pelagibacteraceae bacterium]PHX89251.1 MAG: cell envelope biogenesis protein LolA [Pelagibacteraceae bacterium]